MLSIRSFVLPSSYLISVLRSCSLGNCIVSISNAYPTIRSRCSTRMMASVSATATTQQEQEQPVALPKVAVAQLCTGHDKWINLHAIAYCAGQASASQCQVLCLPEVCGFLGRSTQETLDQAEPSITKDNDNNTIPNPTVITESLRETVQRYKEHPQLPFELPPTETTSTTTTTVTSLLQGLQSIAMESHLWITGTLHTRVADCDTKIYNTHIVIDNQGHLQTTYHKAHLFNVEIPERNVKLQESATTRAGTTLTTCISPIGMLGLSICYDVRFPELYIELVRRGQAQILLVPSAFTVPTGQAHWHTLLQARAIESQCYVLAAAQVGRHNEKRVSYGHALAVDPWGKILADAGGIDHDDTTGVTDEYPPSIVTCEIDLEKLHEIRRNMPIQQHRSAAHYRFEGPTNT